MRARRNARNTAWLERASGSSSANARRRHLNEEWRTIGRDRDKGSTGGGGTLRPPDQTVEPEDEGIHLRRTQRHLHHRSEQNTATVSRSRGVHHQARLEGRNNSLRRDQATSS